MPSNANYVCFDCRTHVRRGKVASGIPICPSCGQGCQSIGYKTPIPRKDDARAWDELAARIRQQKLGDQLSRQEASVRQLHELERQLEELVRRPSNEGRERSIRELKRRIVMAKRED